MIFLIIFSLFPQDFSAPKKPRGTLGFCKPDGNHKQTGSQAATRIGIKPATQGWDVAREVDGYGAWVVGT